MYVCEWSKNASLFLNLQTKSDGKKKRNDRPDKDNVTIDRPYVSTATNTMKVEVLILLIMDSEETVKKENGCFLGVVLTKSLSGTRLFFRCTHLVKDDLQLSRFVG